MRANSLGNRRGILNAAIFDRYRVVRFAIALCILHVDLLPSGPVCLILSDGMALATRVRAIAD